MADWDGDGMGGAPWQSDGAAAWAGYGDGLVFGSAKRVRTRADDRFWSTDAGRKVQHGIIEAHAQGNPAAARAIAREVERGKAGNATALAGQLLNNREGRRYESRRS